MTSDEARELMLKHCISFSDLSRVSAMTEDAIRRHVTKRKGKIPFHLEAIILKEAHVRAHSGADRA